MKGYDYIFFEKIVVKISNYFLKINLLVKIIVV